MLFVLTQSCFHFIFVLMQACENEIDKKRKFYEGVQKRGPTAFNLLLESLFQSGNHDAAKIIDAQFIQCKLAQPPPQTRRYRNITAAQPNKNFFL